MIAATDITFHYPPELFNLLVDTIPLLNRSKKDVVLFLQGAGVPSVMLQDIRSRLGEDPAKLNKFEIVRTVLERLNNRGEAALQQRREVLKRVVEFTNYDACWSEDQLKAKGLVSAIRDVVNQKDAFTRMNQAWEEERKARLAEAERVNREKRESAQRIKAAKHEFYTLFGAALTPQQRGKKLEAALNNIFAAYGILVREPGSPRWNVPLRKYREASEEEAARLGMREPLRSLVLLVDTRAGTNHRAEPVRRAAH